MLFANDWALSSLIRMHEGIVHLVRFSGRELKECEVTYRLAEHEVLALKNQFDEDNIPAPRRENISCLHSLLDDKIVAYV